MIVKVMKIRYVMMAILMLFIVQTRECEKELKKLEQASAINTIRLTDIDAIKKRGKLIVLVQNNSTSYFVYRGEPMGYDYELLHSYAEHLGVELEMIVINDLNSILYELNAGKADIAAANLTVTNERNKIVNFSEPLLQTRQVLIQHKPKGWRQMEAQEIEKRLIRNPNELIGKTVHVRKESSFYSRLMSLSEEVGGKINITEASGTFDTEDLIGLVAKGYINYTVADENVAMINQTYYDNIDIQTAISFPQKIAWAIAKKTPKLLDDINKWLCVKKNLALRNFMFTKYYINKRAAGERIESEFFCANGGCLSPYDHAIKKFSKKLRWDWRLMAAMIYQESHFDPEAESWAGAYGLMQLIPATAKRFGLDSMIATPIQNIEAGTNFLIHLDNYWKDYIPDSAERIKYVLASYNVGLGHVIDARNLAMKYDKDPDLWDSNVDYYLLNKSKPKFYTDEVVKYGYCRGEEPYYYVKKILIRMEHYRNVLRTQSQMPVLARLEQAVSQTQKP
ncbi:MAG: transporter substrate-binding domain-containing protein [Bacteroidia bacterium]|nr:transporter substrate-binding domain-containing protein [Bacteroidia bacterium]